MIPNSIGHAWSGGRRLVVALIGAAVLAVLVVAFVATAAPKSTPRSTDDTETAQAESSASPLDLPAVSEAPLGDEAQSVEAADSAVESLVSAGNQILARADGEVEGLDAIASGFVWGELQALATERQQLGYKQVGEAKVTRTSVQSIDLAGSPPSIVLDVCIDSSSVDLVDATGASRKDLLYNASGPVLNAYGAQYIDGTWKVTTHSIPDNATCE